VYQINPHRQWADTTDSGSDHGVAGDAFGGDVRAGAERDVPHVFDNQAITATSDEGFGIGFGVIDNRLHAIAGIARGARQWPTMHHADDGFRGAKNISQRGYLQVIESFFPGRFDIIGSSHQIFHIAAFCTTWFQFKAIEIDINQLKNNNNNKSDKTESLIMLVQSKKDYLNINQVDYTFILLLSIFFNTLILVYYYFKACYFNPWLLIKTSNNSNNQSEQLEYSSKKK
jgi:hypothetical protein